MADYDEQDDSQKTEEPTQKRMDEALKKGQVISSKEVASFLIFLTITILFSSAAGYMGKSFTNILKPFIEQPHEFPTDLGSIKYSIYEVIIRISSIVAVPFLVIMIVAIFSSFLQNGLFVFSSESIQPDLSRISPLKGFSRIFSKKSVMELIKGLIKITIVAIVLYFVIKPKIPILKDLYHFDIDSIISLNNNLIRNLLIATTIIMAFLALLDYFYQRHDYYSNLKMSKRDIKEENKQMEGNPEIKAKLRRIRNERAKNRMMAAVPRADVVITNPTHYSIALIYDSESMRAPVVCAKGLDHIALKIREVASLNDIPIIENPPLARGLYEFAEIDQEIPLDYYKAVAEIISYVYKLKKKKIN